MRACASGARPRRTYLRMSLERSLTALGMDSVDIYHVHWPVPGVDPAETIGALDDMRREGKVRAIAVSNYDLGPARGGRRRRPDRRLPGRLPHDAPGDRGRRAAVVRRARRRASLAYGPIAPRPVHRQDETRARPSPRTTGAPASEFFTDDAWTTRVAVSRELAGDRRRRRASRAVAGRAGRRVGAAPTGGHVRDHRWPRRRAGERRRTSRRHPLTDDEDAAIAERSRPPPRDLSALRSRRAADRLELKARRTLCETGRDALPAA